jgi:sorbitol-specific phosphotransferase system component IIBC
MGQSYEIICIADIVPAVRNLRTEKGYRINMKKNKRALTSLLACILAVSMTAPASDIAGQAGMETVYVSAASRSTTTTQTQKTTTSGKKTKKSRKKIRQQKKKAKKYIGKKLTSLVKAIGKYKKLSKAASCYYENEYDGIAKYDGFVVYCHTENRKTWIVDSVE